MRPPGKLLESAGQKQPEPGWRVVRFTPMTFNRWTVPVRVSSS